jgi:hypothetical protein
MYLLGDASSQCGTEMDDRSRAELVEEFFSSTGVGAPEVEGQLWLKAEGKKTWKKFHFVLRFRIRNTSFSSSLTSGQRVTCGLYYKCFTIVIYDRNDSGQYYKTTITIVIDNPS